MCCTDTTTTLDRFAVITGGADNLEQVRRYLPDNFTADEETVASDGGTSSTRIIIRGHDVAGWTLHDYVIPRLASGLIWAEAHDTDPNPHTPTTTTTDSQTEDKLVAFIAGRIIVDLFADPKTQTLPAVGHYRMRDIDGPCDGCLDLDAEGCVTTLEDITDTASLIERAMDDDTTEDLPELNTYRKGAAWFRFAAKVIDKIDETLREVNGQQVTVTTAAWIQPYGSVIEEGPWPIRPERTAYQHPKTRPLYEILHNAEEELYDFYATGGTDCGYYADGITVTLTDGRTFVGLFKVKETDNPVTGRTVTPTTSWTLLQT